MYMAGPASSGKVARTPVFTKEHLGSDKIPEFFYCRAPKRQQHALFLIILYQLGPALSAGGFWVTVFAPV